MKHTIKILVIAASCLFAAGAAQAAAPKSIDPAASKVTWVGKKVTGQHTGTVRVKGGEVQVEGDVLKGGRIEIDMTTIAVEDLKDADSNAKLTGHLKSDDFFGVDKHPIATLVIRSSKPAAGKPNVQDVTADLTIKGKTNPVAFPVETSVKDGKARAVGKLVLDRTKWDVRYRSVKFFSDLGDKLIHDDFEIAFDVVTK